MHGPFISEIREVVLHCILYLRGEGRVVVVGTWAYATLIKHPVESDFIHTFLK
jgi:hypothetical protein